MLIAKLTTAVAISSLLFAGCSKKNSGSSAAESNKIRVGYIGLTCEAPIFSAVEKGFFKEEGLDVSLVKCEWANYKDVLALGGFDITHHLVMYFLKPIEQGLDVKFTGGIHRGCLRVQAGTRSDIHTVKDLRGKRIGVPGMGTPPFIFANRVLGANGIDAGKEITWRVFPAGELGLGLDRSWLSTIGLASVWLLLMLAYSPWADRLATRWVAEPPTLDVFRALHPDLVQYTYWDYFRNAFEHNWGWRIDHILATAPLAAACRTAEVDVVPRQGANASDHTIVWAEFDC